MNDAIHILLAIALVAIFIKSTNHISYLVAVVGAAIPMTDRFLFNSLIEIGYLGSFWAHRSLTHSLLVAIVFVAMAWYIGYPKAGVLGYGAHIIPDIFLGGVMLFFPITTTIYGGDWLPTFLTNAVVNLISVTVIIWTILEERYELNPSLITKTDIK